MEEPVNDGLNTDNKNNGELEFTKKDILPLATAGALGGLCNGGIQYIISNKYKFITKTKDGDKVVVTPNTPIIYNFFIYLAFSIIIAAIIAPAFAIFSTGFVKTKNLTRLLVTIILLGAFLPITIRTAQNGIYASPKIEALKKEIENKEDKAEEAVEEVLEKNEDVLNRAERNNLTDYLNLIELYTDTLYEFGKISNEVQAITSYIDKLNKLKEKTESINVNGNKQDKNKKDELIKYIENYVRELNEKLTKIEIPETD